MFAQREASPYDANPATGQTSLMVCKGIIQINRHTQLTHDHSQLWRMQTPKLCVFYWIKGHIYGRRMLAACKLPWAYLFPPSNVSLTITSSARDYFLTYSFAKGAPHPTTDYSLRDKFKIEDAVENRDFTCLHRVVLGFLRRDLASEIHDHPELINDTDAHGRTPLWWSTFRGDMEQSATLLANGADTNLSDIKGWGPSHNCAMYGSAAMMELLVKSGADVTKKTLHGTTPLHFSCQSHSQAEATRLLLNRGLGCNPRDGNNATAFGLCATHGDDVDEDIFLQNGANPILCHGVLWNNAIHTLAHQVLRVLIRYGCNITTPLNGKETILHWAARYGNEDTIEDLKQADLSNLDADAVDEDGQTAEDELEQRFYDEEHLYKRSCSPKLYQGLKELIARVRVKNRQSA
jgi:ankyrin repeat protein